VTVRVVSVTFVTDDSRQRPTVIADTANLRAISLSLQPVILSNRSPASRFWAWVSDNHPRLAEAIEVEVDRGAVPADIRRYVMDKTQRLELALRCEQGAAWLVEMGEG
jgi:hypothetical protein